MLQLKPEKPVRVRIVISVLIGIATGTFSWFLLAHLHQGAGDFNWAIWAARDLLARKNPYAEPMQLYPLPAALFGLPFVWMRPSIAGGAFYGISSALLAFGLTRHSYWRLLIFLAYPYWAGILVAQWPPLIMASAFIPYLMPAAMAKPQLGIPVFFSHLSRRGVVACVAMGLLTLAVLPRWPWWWVGNFGQYERFIPLLVLPGPLLLLALARYRDRDAHLLLLMAAMPQRWFYDTFMLWLIPKTRKEILLTALFSWGLGIWRWYHIPHTFVEVGRWEIFLVYLPMLVVVLMRMRRESPKAAAPDPAA
jgi:hypothetical protein